MRLLASLGAVTDCGDQGWREVDGIIDATGSVPSIVDGVVVRTVDTTAAEDWASSGAMLLTGRADGPPLRCPGRPASVAWGALLATELLARLGGRDVLLPGPRVLAERAAIAGFSRRAPVSADGTFVAPSVKPGKPGWPIVLNGHERRASRVDHLPAVPPRRLRLAPTLVVDLSTGWAGALCGHLLTLVGARVIRVESSAEPGEFRDLLHAGQESVALRGEQLTRLLARADVVLDDSGRPRGEAACWVRIGQGSGDAAAAEAGLVAFDAEAGVPAPCGDAIAEPLAGVHAALTALACRLGGGRWFAELSLRAAAAAALDGALEPGPCPAPAPPVARRPAGRAPAPGADTARVARELGLAAPTAPPPAGA